MFEQRWSPDAEYELHRFFVVCAAHERGEATAWHPPDPSEPGYKDWYYGPNGPGANADVDSNTPGIQFTMDPGPGSSDISITPEEREENEAAAAAAAGDQHEADLTGAENSMLPGGVGASQENLDDVANTGGDNPAMNDMETELNSNDRFGGVIYGANGTPVLATDYNQQVIADNPGSWFNMTADGELVPIQPPKNGMSPAQWQAQFPGWQGTIIGGAEFKPVINEDEPGPDRNYQLGTQFGEFAMSPLNDAITGNRGALDKANEYMLNPMSAPQLDGGRDVSANSYRGKGLQQFAKTDRLGQMRADYGQLQGNLNDVVNGEDDLFNDARALANEDYANDMRTNRDLNIRGQQQSGIGGSSLAAASNRNFDIAAEHESQTIKLGWASKDREHRMQAMQQIGDNIATMSDAELTQLATQVDAEAAYSQQEQEAGKLELDADKSNQENERVRDIENLKAKLETEFFNRNYPNQVSEIAARSGGIVGDAAGMVNAQANLGGTQEEGDQANAELRTKIAAMQSPTEKMRGVLEDQKIMADILGGVYGDRVESIASYLSAEYELGLSELELRNFEAELSAAMGLPPEAWE